MVIKKILIVELRPGIGDLCMFLPRFHEISKKYPNAHITLLTKTRTKALQLLKFDRKIQKVVFIDEEITKKKKSFKFLFNLYRENKFDIIFSYQYGPKYLKYVLLGKFFKAKVYFYGIFKKKESMMMRAIKSNEIWLKIKILERKSDIELADKILIKKNQIVIGVGASGDNKRWPIKKFNNLIKYLKKYNFTFIISGGPDESEIIKSIKKNHKDIKIISIEKLNIEDSIQIIKSAKYHIGNDSGFMHICAALKIKSFCLYGDTPSEDSSYNNNIIPILPDGYSKISHGSRLMNKISLKRVIEVFDKNLC